MEKIVTFILDSEKTDSLGPLTASRSKSAVPFGGKFRVIDFALSNCVNSGLYRIYVLTKDQSLHEHIELGWNIPGLNELIHSIPAKAVENTDSYPGSADMLKQNLDLIDRNDIEQVVIMPGDQICKINCAQLIKYHKDRKAGLTIAAIRLSPHMVAGRLSMLEVDRDGRVTGFREKPSLDSSVIDDKDYWFTSMGIYVFDVKTLIYVLDKMGGDFGHSVIPGMVSARRDIFFYDYIVENKIEDFVIEVIDGRRKGQMVKRTPDSSYWDDISTIDSYYRANMELVSLQPRLSLYGRKWPFRTIGSILPPSKFVMGANVSDSLVGDGCIISGGTIKRSILSPGVIVEKEAIIEDSILFDSVIVEPYANISHTIVDKGTVIRQGTYIGHNIEEDLRRGCRISDAGIRVVPKGLEIRPV